MAPHTQEVFEAPKPEHQEKTTSSLDALKGCGSLHCQSSRVSQQEERTSERAIEPLLDIMQANVKSVLSNKGPIFRQPIFHALSQSKRYRISNAFTDGLPAEKRGIMKCTACKKFMKKYGDLCVVADDGSLIPLAWPTNLESVPPYYRTPVKNVLKLFCGQVVCEEFENTTVRNHTLGTPTNRRLEPYVN